MVLIVQNSSLTQTPTVDKATMFVCKKNHRKFCAHRTRS